MSVAAIVLSCCLVGGDSEVPLQEGWPVEIGAGRVVTFDLDGDGLSEVLFKGQTGVHVLDHEGGELPGWPFLLGGYADPAVGDVTGDGELNVVLVQSSGGSGSLYVLDTGGQLLEGWPVELPFTTGNTPTLADVDGDGVLEFVRVDAIFDCVWAVEVDGTPVPGWPVELEVPPASHSWSGQAVGDVDLDGKDDLAIAIRMYYDSFPGPDLLYLFSGDGCLFDGFPMTLTVPPNSDDISALALADMDGDSYPEIVGTGVNCMFAIRRDGTAVFQKYPLYGAHREVICADMDSDGQLDVVGAGAHVWVYTRPFLLESTAGGDFENFYGTCVGDVNGDGEKEIVAWSNSYLGMGGNALHLFDRYLQELPGWPKFFGGPTASIRASLADLDGDDDLEIIHALPGQCVAWDQPNDLGGKVTVDWGMLHHDPTYSSNAHQGETVERVFLRGDASSDGFVGLEDAIQVLEYACFGGVRACPAALDVDDDGDVDLVDGVTLLDYLYTGGAALSEPFPECAVAPEDGLLPCEQFSCP